MVLQRRRKSDGQSIPWRLCGRGSGVILVALCGFSGLVWQIRFEAREVATFEVQVYGWYMKRE